MKLWVSKHMCIFYLQLYFTKKTENIRIGKTTNLLQFWIFCFQLWFTAVFLHKQYFAEPWSKEDWHHLKCIQHILYILCTLMSMTSKPQIFWIHNQSFLCGTPQTQAYLGCVCKCFFFMWHFSIKTWAFSISRGKLAFYFTEGYLNI